MAKMGLFQMPFQVLAQVWVSLGYFVFMFVASEHESHSVCRPERLGVGEGTGAVD